MRIPGVNEPMNPCVQKSLPFFSFGLLETYKNHLGGVNFYIQNVSLDVVKFGTRDQTFFRNLHPTGLCFRCPPYLALLFLFWKLFNWMEMPEVQVQLAKVLPMIRLDVSQENFLTISEFLTGISHLFSKRK